MTSLSPKFAKRTDWTSPEELCSDNMAVGDDSEIIAEKCEKINCVDLLIKCKDCEVNKEFKEKTGLDVRELYR